MSVVWPGFKPPITIIFPCEKYSAASSSVVTTFPHPRFPSFSVNSWAYNRETDMAMRSCASGSRFRFFAMFINSRARFPPPKMTAISCPCSLICFTNCAYLSIKSVLTGEAITEPPIRITMRVNNCHSYMYSGSLLKQLLPDW